MPATQIMIADAPPNDAAVTVYDRDHFALYMRLLDANDAGASLEEVSSLLRARALALGAAPKHLPLRPNEA